MRLFPTLKNPLAYVNINTVIIFLFLLQRLCDDTYLPNRTPFESELPKLPKKCNGNAPSDVYQDVTLNPKVGIIGRFSPWNLATLERILDDRPRTLSAQKHFEEWHRNTSQSFFQNARNVLSEKEEKHDSFTSVLEDEAWKEFYDLSSHISSAEKKIVLEQQLIKVLQYRFHTEAAIFASQLDYINCGEHASIAFVDELIRAKNGDWPKDRSLKLYYISLGATESANDHHFLVVGSTTLPETELITHDKVRIASILEAMDGEIVDNWNNPKAGGLRLSASAARKKFLMYSPRISEAWDCMEIAEYSAKICIYKFKKWK